MTGSMGGSTIVFVVNTDWFFLTHRLPLALRAQAEGARVVVMATDSGRAREIEDAGLEFFDLRMTRRGRNPWRELGTLRRLRAGLRKFHPTLVHLVATKSLVYGGLAARSVGVPHVVSAVTGAGYALNAEQHGLTQQIVRAGLRRVLRWSDAVLFQHGDDVENYVNSGLTARDRCRVVGGVGVDPAGWRARPEPSSAVVVLAARMIEEKGIRTFVDAARRVRQTLPQALFVLVGPLEPELPTAIEPQQLDAWAREGVAEWWGVRQDMPQVLEQCQVLVLPTFHNEGVPKTILEAGASRRAVVASDIPGCRAIIQHGVSGLLVPPRDPTALADALLEVLTDPVRRAELAGALHDVVLERFTERELSEATLDVYRECLACDQ